VPGALSRLEQLLARYPASPLAQGALVRKFRLLSSAGRPGEARREAERYLAAYPTGFAVAEAEALKQGVGGAASPPSPGEPETP
jgi:outer membrane protein assembly factor BamD (BamD/ComL family)